MNSSHPFMLMEWMAYYVSDIVLGTGYGSEQSKKFLSCRTLCSAGFRAHRPLSIAGGPTGKQGVMVGAPRRRRRESVFCGRTGVFSLPQGIWEALTKAKDFAKSTFTQAEIPNPFLRRRFFYLPRSLLIDATRRWYALEKRCSWTLCITKKFRVASSHWIATQGCESGAPGTLARTS